MMAIAQTKYGSPDVLQLKEVDKPMPVDNEVLTKIHATTVTTSELVARKGDPFMMRFFTGLRRPKKPIPGCDFAREIETVGKAVKLFKEGDQVFGSGFNGKAEYICLPEDGVPAIKPANMTYEEATAVPEEILTALPCLRDKGNIQRGQKTLISGASGSIGAFSVQLAENFGAEVTVVCGTTSLVLMKSLGVGKVNDYSKEDFTKSGQTYDLIFDPVGKSSFSRCKGSLEQNGLYLTTVPIFLQMLWTSIVGSKKAIWSSTGLRPSSEKSKDLIFIKGLIEEGKIESVIDRRYPLEQIAEAQYVEKGHKKGNLTITVEHNT